MLDFKIQAFIHCMASNIHIIGYCLRNLSSSLAVVLGHPQFRANWNSLRKY